MAVQSPARDDAYSSSMMPNIDAGDEDDPQTAVDYVNDIYNYLRSLEVSWNALYVWSNQTTLPFF